MLLDLNFEITDLKEKSIPFADGKTAAEIFSNFLVTRVKKISGISEIKLKKLCKQLNSKGKVDLSKEEFVSLKNLIQSDETLIILIRADIEEGFIESELQDTKQADNADTVPV